MKTSNSTWAVVWACGLLTGFGCRGPQLDLGPAEAVRVGDVEWDALNPARGDASPLAGTLWGDRSGEVATGFLFRPVDGFRSPPHIHNVTYRGVVIAGEVHNDGAEAAEMWMPAGSFWTQPKGAPHITAARGEDVLAYIEIDAGPYLVQPVEEAWDSGERPINVDASNVVWVDVEGGVQRAFLWGDPQSSEASGSLVRCPGGWVGTLGSEGVLRAVVVSGSVEVEGEGEPGGAPVLLEPGSLIASDGGRRHRLRDGRDGQLVLYLRTDGRLRIEHDGSWIE